MIALAQAPISFIATRRMSRAGLDRAKFERMQARSLARWLKTAVPRVRAFDGRPGSLSDLPVMDKAQLIANFANYNTQGISADAVRAAMQRDFRIGDLTVGASTGTSGNRGLFVISDAERFRWLGSILAKTMADLLWRRQRVAIILPQGTGLYESANHVRQIQLRFFDLTEGPEAWQAQLEAFDPTVVVAPPKVLRFMAEAAFELQPSRVFSGAETLDPVDRPVIESAFGQPLEQIYMATEGLLGVTCRLGHLHLAEDSVHFEFEDVGDGLASPLITTFRRQTQILARYRMNDLLRLAPAPCACGSPLQHVAEVVGRMDDCFHLHGTEGAVLMTPDVLRNAVLMADVRITDFRLVQVGAEAIALTLPPGLPEAARRAAQTSLEKLLKHRAVRAQIEVVEAAMPLDVSRKLRRVERRFVPGSAP